MPFIDLSFFNSTKEVNIRSSFSSSNDVKVVGVAKEKINNMKIAFVNLPSDKKLIRRYTCSYYAANFLFPPIELMYLASIVRELEQEKAIIIDAVAEELSVNDVIKQLKSFQVELLVFMTGIETFSADLAYAEKIKHSLPDAKTICFGYLPTQFPLEVLENAPFIDFIILGEPERTFAALYDKLKKNEEISDLPGVARREGGRIYEGSDAERIDDLDDLPFPSRNLMKTNLYHEFLSPRPFATIQASRGCPFLCTYCIRTFGNKVYFRSIRNVLEEIKQLVKEGIRTVRFIDDDFCLDKARLKEICGLIIKEDFKFRWSCLSRADHLDEQVLSLMKEAGCFRVYLGIESFSKRISGFCRKTCNVDVVISIVKRMRRLGIQSVGFFMVGGIQTREELEEDIQCAVKSDLSYIVVEKMTPYPGTEFFEQVKENIVFQLFPYQNRLKDVQEEQKVYLWEKEFYRRFYFRPGYILRSLTRAFFYPKDIWDGLKELWIFFRRPFDVDEERRDLI